MGDLLKEGITRARDLWNSLDFGFGGGTPAGTAGSGGQDGSSNSNSGSSSSSSDGGSNSGGGYAGQPISSDALHVSNIISGKYSGRQSSSESPKPHERRVKGGVYMNTASVGSLGFNAAARGSNRTIGLETSGTLDYASKANYAASVTGTMIGTSGYALLSPSMVAAANGAAWLNMSAVERKLTIDFSQQLGLKALGNIATGMGIGTSVVGVAFDAYSWYSGEMSDFKFGVNSGMAAWGLTTVGTVPALFYFGAQTFHPRGIRGVLEDISQSQRQIDKIMNRNPRKPHFYLLPWGSQKL